MNDNPFKQAAVFAVVGFLVGAAVGMHYARWRFQRFWREGPNTERMISKLSRQLSLDARQQEQMKSILESQKAKIMALHQEMSRQFQSVRRSMHDDISKILTPDQRKKFEAITARWDAHHRCGPPGVGGPGGGPPPPPNGPPPLP